MNKRVFLLRPSVIRFLSHLLFWTVYLFYHVLIYTFRREDPDLPRIISNLAITMPVDVLAAYFTAYVLLQRYLFKRQYFKFVLAWSVSAFALLSLQRIIMYYYIIPTYGTVPEGEGFWDFNYFNNLLNIYVPVGIFLSVKLLKFWYRDQKIQKDLERQNIRSELALLRSQVNPHFLFNTLNNIDTLVREDQEKASDSIMKLSEIMRYMIFNSKGPRVSLSKEYSYLRSYISLQQIRMKDPDEVVLQVEGAFHGLTIAPMILIPFVENAFKHGFMDRENCKVDILLRVEGSSLVFRVSNCINPHLVQNKDGTSGIGLENVKRRLELIYPSRYDLDIHPGPKEFIVTLKLILDED